MGDKRVMHGAQDNFGSLEDAGEGVIVFKPNGESKVLSTMEEMRSFYRNELGGRQTAVGAYPRISLQEAMRAMVWTMSSLWTLAPEHGLNREPRGCQHRTTTRLFTRIIAVEHNRWCNPP